MAKHMLTVWKRSVAGSNPGPVLPERGFGAVWGSVPCYKMLSCVRSLIYSFGAHLLLLSVSVIVSFLISLCVFSLHSLCCWTLIVVHNRGLSCHAFAYAVWVVVSNMLSWVSKLHLALGSSLVCVICFLKSTSNNNRRKKTAEHK